MNNNTETFEKSDRPKVHPSLSKKSILVVDDDDTLLSLNKVILEAEDYEVFIASSGSKALELLTQIPRLDLILLDMCMSGMSGPEFLLELEVRRPDILAAVPVIFLTAMDKVPASRASGFIRKPMDLDCFLGAIHRFIELGVGQELTPH